MTVADSADLVIAGGTDGRWDRLARACRGASSSTGSGCGSSVRTNRCPANVGRRIDATGRVVAPGFIDLHSHGGLMILAEPRHEPKVRQGITTEIVGVDGNSFAPFPRREDLEAFVELDSGLDGRPAIDYDWDSVGRYLERFDGTVSVNVGTLVGNSALRIAALGWDDVAGRCRGRWTGCGRCCAARSTRGRSGSRRGSTTRPGAYATTEELAELTAEAGRAGGFYHSHVRYQLGDRYLDPFREAIEIGRRAGAPAHITHFYHRETHPGPAEALLELVDDARATGLDVTFDTYPSEWASTRLLIQLPLWIQAGGPGPLKAATGRPERPRPAPCRDRGAWRGLHGTRPAGRTCASGPSPTPTTCAGSRGRSPR